MEENPISLGDLESSERLITELYIDLRKRINNWAAVTQQTAQARMGYVGQHLVSVVTGFPGGKSGARGQDLVLPDDEYAEIKTCYRVDQLGKCNSCDEPVASIEPNCPRCESTNIKRNDDSKWLIGIRNEEELAEILEPKSYYLVLFDFVNLQAPERIRSSIWEVDPKKPGFAFCMVDYRYNIQSKSTSRAAFNLWPFQLKFGLMRPILMYRSTISTVDDSIETSVFPGRDESQLFTLEPLQSYSRSRNLTFEKIKNLAELLEIPGPLPESGKGPLLQHVQAHISQEAIGAEIVADSLAKAIYLKDIEELVPELPQPLRSRIADLL